MPCAFARIRTSFTCTSICRLVASASCQLPVGIGQLPVRVPNVGFRGRYSVLTDNWQLLPWSRDNRQPTSAASPPRSHWQLTLTTPQPTPPFQLATLRPEPTRNWQPTLTTNFAFFLDTIGGWPLC